MIFRGMIPRLTKRGTAAMSSPPPFFLLLLSVDRLKVFEFPVRHEECLEEGLSQKPPQILRRNSQVGWTKKNLIDRLEEKRINRSCITEENSETHYAINQGNIN